MSVDVHHFLKRRREVILQAWEADARRLPEAGQLGRLALLDDLPEMLDRIVGWMESGAALPGEMLAGPAGTHAEVRVDEQVPLGEVIEEYRLLRGVVFRLLAAEDGREQTGFDAATMQRRVEDLARLDSALDDALNQTVRAYLALHRQRLAIEERLRLALESAAIGTWDLDVQSGRLTWDARGREVLDLPGKPPESYRRFLGTVHPADRGRLRQLARDALREARDGELRTEFRVGAGGGRSARWVDARGKVIFDRGGRAVRVIGTLQDTTDRKAAETSLRQSEERERARAAELATVLDAVPALMLITRDPTARHIEGNRFTCELLQIPAGANLSKTAPPATRLGHFHYRTRTMQGNREIPPHELPMQVAAATGRELRDYELSLVFQDGHARHLVGNAVPLLDPEGRPRGAVGAFIDITERKRAEEALRDAGRRREEFLAVLSHELRNPLAAARNSLFVLDRSRPGGEQARHALEVINRQVGQLTRLVEDLLDVSRIRTGKIQLQPSRLDLADLVRRTAEDQRPLFHRAHLQLQDRLPERPVWISGDATRLAQVLSNLLQNAVKFTPPGGRAWLTLETEGQLARLRVRDTGRGFEPAVRDRLFRPFEQVDVTQDRSRGGLGLGLALVKGLIELHGGKVEGSSPGLGQGAEFEVQLPTIPASPERVAVTPGRARSEAERSLRVLVIEDNEDTASTLQEVLTFIGHRAEIAHTGSEGLAMVRRSPPDAILCDIGLPGMSGYDVARAIRADRGFRQPALIALTGYTLPEDSQRATEAGFDRHLGKPLAPDELARTLASVVREDEARS